jgi:hypothetical protein
LLLSSYRRLDGDFRRLCKVLRRRPGTRPPQVDGSNDRCPQSYGRSSEGGDLHAPRERLLRGFEQRRAAFVS